MTTERDYWETPQEVFDKLNARYRFDVDVAANLANTKCEWFISERKNALTVPWHSGIEKTRITAYCNPPYSRGQVPLWLAKAREEAQHQVSTVMLLNYCADAAYFRPYLDVCRVIPVTPRIQFVPPPGVEPSQNSKGQMLALFGIGPSARYWDWKEDVWGCGRWHIHIC